jgi:hypothetical protein
MMGIVRTAILSLLICIGAGMMSCDSDPRAKLQEDAFTAMAAQDPDALGKALGLGGSTPEIEQILADVKRLFGDIRRKGLLDEQKDFMGGAVVGRIVLSPGEADRGTGAPFIGSTGKEGVMEFSFAGSSPAPCEFSVTLQIEAVPPNP